MLQLNSARISDNGPGGPAFPKRYDAPLPVNLMDIDLFAETGHPFEAYAKMREAAPVAWHESGDATESGFWALTRYADIRAASLDTKTFSSQAGGIMIANGTPETRHPLLFRASVDAMICLDAPAHIQLRKEHMPFFTVNYVGDLKKRVDAKVASLIDTMKAAFAGQSERMAASAKLPDGQLDMVEYFSAELPLFTLCEILGVPEGDRYKLIDWMHYLEVAQDTMTRVRGGAAPTAEDMEFFAAFLAKVDEMFAYGREILLSRRREPKADLLSAIANMKVDGDLLPDEYLDGSWLLIVFAGNDTTRNTLSGTMKLLTENPATKTRLLADPGLLPKMVDEAIRHVTPVIYMRRTAIREGEIDGQRIAEGEKIVMWYGAANRDPSIFPDPDKFDIDRRNAGDHLAFGMGSHVCIGKRVAQMQLESAYRQLHARMPSLRYAGGIDRAPNNFVVAIRGLPVELGA